MKTRKLKRGWWRRLWSRNAQEDVEREIGWSQYRLEGWLGYRAAVAGLRFDLRVRHVFRDSRLPSASHAIEHTSETIYQTLGELDT